MLQSYDFSPTLTNQYMVRWARNIAWKVMKVNRSLKFIGNYSGMI